MQGLNALYGLLCLFCCFLGFTTDGEFNSLRTVGLVRPISVVGLIKTARNEAQAMHVKIITAFFTLDKHGTR